VSAGNDTRICSDCLSMAREIVEHRRLHNRRNCA
jgi:hypothetical protein